MSKEATFLPNEEDTQTVEKYEFDPIKGYPRLNWKGKRPFRGTQYYPAQLKETYSEPIGGWLNKIFWGDNLQVMSHLLKDFRGKVQLVYLDPPFDSKADYKKTIKLKGKSVENDSTTFEEKQYTDIWTNDEYLQFMYERLILIRELLSENGSVFLHCDWHKNHLLRSLLDEVFGQDNFQNEIVVYYTAVGLKGKSNKYHQNTETILYYAKNKGNHIWNPTYVPIENPDNYRTASKHVWNPDTGKADRLRDEEGNIQYFTVKHNKADNFITVPALRGNKKLGYPTQKHEEILERIIKSATNPGDIVFDCFMGSGTTQAVSMRLGRKFIGSDINRGSIQTTVKRLLNLKTKIESSDMAPGDLYGRILDQGKDDDLTHRDIKTKYTSFSVYNVNNYDVFRNPVQAKEILMEALEIQRMDYNSLYDGEKDGYMVKIMPVNQIATKPDLNELITGFDYKTFEKRKRENPTQPVEKLLLVCMGHEPDLKATLKHEVGYDLEVEIVDILRDKSEIEFKRDSEADIEVKDGELIINNFFPMNLLQKLSIMKENVQDWRELVETITIDWNYDGAVMEPEIVDIPESKDLVKGNYVIPDDAGTIRVKITDLLSESLEVEVENG